MKHINYFDLGLYKGEEVDMFLSEIDGVYDYTVYGFEAHPAAATNVSQKFADNQNVFIYNKAITDKENAGNNINLYLERSGQGNSIFPTKNNVDRSRYVTTNSISFVDWVIQNVPNYKESYNILRFNIEGAELLLMNDIIDSNFNQYIDLYLGSIPGRDINQVAEIKHYHDSFIKQLSDNDIVILPYCKGLANNISISDKILEL